MNRERKKLSLNKNTLRTLSTTQLDKARGGLYADSRITCDIYCWYWSYFTR